MVIKKKSRKKGIVEKKTEEADIVEKKTEEADIVETVPEKQPAVVESKPEEKPVDDKKTCGLAVTSLVLGIIGLVFSWVPGFGFLLGIIGVICGFSGLKKIRESNFDGKGIAIVGIILGFVAIAINLLAIIGFVAFFNVMAPEFNAPPLA